MYKGLKVWLALWAISLFIIMFISLDTNVYVIFSFQKLYRNVLAFTPATAILFESVLFQAFFQLTNKLLIPGVVLTIAYFGALITCLPYEPLACILSGVLALPVAFFHYSISGHFFGEIYER